MRSYRTRSLANTTLYKLALPIALVILFSALFSYRHYHFLLEKKLRIELKDYILERGNHESEIFKLSEENHQILTEKIRNTYQNLQSTDINQRFEQLFQHQYGTLRLNPSYYLGHIAKNGELIEGITGYLEKGIEPTPEIKRYLLTMFEIIRQYGPAWSSWQDYFPNLYLIAHGDMLVEYWKGVPWGLDAADDLDLAKEDWVFPADQQHNPKKNTVWTSTYYDQVADDWMISCVTPVYIKEQHIFTIGHDIFLKKLLQRTNSTNYYGTYNLIFHRNGTLIAHPQKKQLIKKIKSYNIMQSKDAELIDIYDAVTKSSRTTNILDHEDNFIAITRLYGTDWFFVMVYPKSILHNEALNTAKNIALYALFSLCVVTYIIFYILKKYIAKPLQHFTSITNKIKSGLFTLDKSNETQLNDLIQMDIPLEFQNEISQLANAFHLMLKEINSSYIILEEYNLNLNTKVNERTKALSDALESLKNTQNELIHAEKMAALGQLIAGVAHEINTPLGAIRSSVDYMSHIMIKFHPLIENITQMDNVLQKMLLDMIHYSLQQEPHYSLKEERKIKRQLINRLKQEDITNSAIIADKLVDMGIYATQPTWHPLFLHQNNSQYITIAHDISGLYRRTKTIKTATNQAAKIVFALKNYARQDQFNEKVLANITEGLETVLTLYFNQLKQGIEVFRKYSDVPAIYCYPDELIQVWTNLIHNALHAMQQNGCLNLTIFQQNEFITITINDNGCGIDPAIIKKIYQPFYTTKPLGEGSGLGLNIVKKLIAKHHGKIELTSEPGNTTFTIKLPIHTTSQTQ